MKLKYAVATGCMVVMAGCAASGTNTNALSGSLEIKQVELQKNLDFTKMAPIR